MPSADVENDPSFNNYKPHALPVFTESGVWMRLIDGGAFGLKNGVKTNSPLFYLHVVLEPGTHFGLLQEYTERGVYVVKGSLEVSGRLYAPGQLLVFNSGVDPVLVAKAPTTLMLLGGEPLGERFIWWNFVSSRRERIEQAKADWQAGRIALPPNDNAQFVPLPQDRSRPAGGPAPELLS